MKKNIKIKSLKLLSGAIVVSSVAYTQAIPVLNDNMSGVVNPVEVFATELDSINLDASDDLDASYDLDISDDLDISGDLDASGDLDISDDLDISGDLDASGDLDISDDLDASDDLDISTDLDISNDLDTSDDLDTSGDLDISDNLDISDDLDASDDLDDSTDLDDSDNLDIDLEATQEDILRPAPKFSDVNVTAPYYRGLEFLYQYSIIEGTTESTFSPDSYMTRAMLVSILYRLESWPELDANTNLSEFSDVEITHWYGKAVLWAKSVGLVSGITDTTFAPNQNLTKEQVIVILDRYYNNYYVANGVIINSELDGTIADINLASSYSKDAINNMYSINILFVDKYNRLNPQNYINRADVAYMLGELLLKINN